GLAVGLVPFVWAGTTESVVVVFIAAWAFVMGSFQIVVAIRLRKEIENEWLLGLSGVVSVIFGVLMFLQPAAGAVAVVWIIGAYAIFFGVLLIVLGFRLKRHTGTGSPAPA